MKYTDKNNNEIKEGMTLRHDDGDIEVVLKGVTELGFNASNPNYKGGNATSLIYPLHEFDLTEWGIIK